MTGPYGSALVREDCVCHLAQPDSDAFQERDQFSVVLPCIPDAAGGERREELCPRCALAADVDRGCSGLVPNLASGPPKPAAQILVLAGHEEALVPAADLRERRSSREQARPRDPLDGARLFVQRRVVDDLVGP